MPTCASAIRAVVLRTLRKWSEQTVANRNAKERLAPATAITEPPLEIVEFLRDTDPALATAAARTIHDRPLSELWPQLAGIAQQVTRQPSPEALIRRVLSAHFKLGDAASIERVMQIARSSHTPPQLQAEALDARPQNRHRQRIRDHHADPRRWARGVRCGG